ncbi:MAG: RNB domain-containing ribonuclease, partial [Nitratireductor sp.]
MSKTKAEIKKLKKAKAARRNSRGVPTREEILKFIESNPSQIGKREIGRAFNVKGSAKIDLKAVLKEMAQEGLLKRRGKKVDLPGALPPVALVDIITRDRDGGLLARSADTPTKAKNPPTIAIASSKGPKGVVAGVGSRVLARLTKNVGEGADYNGKIVKIVEKHANTILGILRLDANEPRIVPIVKRQDEIIVPVDKLNGAQAGDLVEIEPINSFKRHGLKHGKVARIIGSGTSEKAISMISIYAHEIPHIFPDETLSEAQAVEPIDPKKMPHEDWRDVPLITIDPMDAKDHDDAIYAIEDPENEGGFICSVAIADVSWYVRTQKPMDNEALIRGNSVYFPDRVVPMLPERISNDLCSLRELEDRPALCVKMWFNKEGKKTKHTFHRALVKSHAKLAYEEAQNAIDGNPNEKAKPHLEP